VPAGALAAGIPAVIKHRRARPPTLAAERRALDSERVA
jgi:hypothetical protein